MKKGCSIYVGVTIFTMLIGGFLSSQEDTMSFGGLFFGVVFALIVGFYMLYRIKELLKERFNPIILNVLFYFLVIIAAFATIYILGNKL